MRKCSELHASCALRVGGLHAPASVAKTKSAAPANHRIKIISHDIKSTTVVVHTCANALVDRDGQRTCSS
jgi:hypothetical protein